jgi:hypothetical protein
VFNQCPIAFGGVVVQGDVRPVLGGKQQRPSDFGETQ